MTKKNRPSPLGIRLDDGKESRVKYSTPDEHKKRGKYYFTVQDIADISSVSTSTIRQRAAALARRRVSRGRSMKARLWNIAAAVVIGAGILAAFAAFMVVIIGVAALM